MRRTARAKSINVANIIQPKYQEIVQKKKWIQRLGFCIGGDRTWRLKEGQVVNRLAEEYGKDHRQAITDEVVLERVAEAAKKKYTLPSQRVALLSRELMMWQCVSPNAVHRFREMRSSDLLHVEEDFPFTERTVLI